MNIDLKCDAISHVCTRTVTDSQLAIIYVGRDFNVTFLKLHERLKEREEEVNALFCIRGDSRAQRAFFFLFFF